MKSITGLFVLCCVICSVKHSDSARILAIFPWQLYSHFLVGREVLKILADRGHQVDVVSHYPLETEYSNYTNMINITTKVRFSALNNLTLDIVQNHFMTISVETLARVAGIDTCSFMGLPEFRSLITDPPRNPPYDLVIVEAFIANCYFAFGRHLEVPVIGIFSGGILPSHNEMLGNPCNTAYVKQVSGGSMHYMNFWQRFKNTVLSSLFVGQIKYYSHDQTELVRKYFGPDMPDIEELQRDIALILVNSHFTLTGVRPLTPAVVEIGGLHVTNDKGALSPDLKKWLDESKNGFVYISLGSMVKIESFPTKTLLALYSAFTKLKPIRFLMKVANPEELPPGLPDNVKTLPWVPQIQVLKHDNIKVFVSHGGVNGILEAVTYAVPLIGIPLSVDQPLNIDNIVEKGAAISLDYKDFQDEEFSAAVTTIIRNTSYRMAMNKLSRRFLHRPLTSRDTAVFWVEYILEHGADALKSPATRLTWWQLALIDVYGTILLAVLIIVYTIKVILSTVIHRIAYKSTPSSKTKKTN